MLPLFGRLYRRNLGKLLFFSACLGTGVAFLFAGGSILDAVDRAVAERSRELLAADLEVSSNRPFDEEARKLFAELESEGARVAPMTSFSSMLRPADFQAVPFLVSVKAVTEAYPLYGELVVEPASAELAPGSCLLEDTAALQHSVAVGDTVRLGDARLKVAGLIKAEPDKSMTRFSFAPRLIIPRATVAETGLVRFGSRIRHRRLIALPPSEDPAGAARAAKSRVETTLDSPYVRVTAYADAEPTISRVLKRVTGFFVVVALVTLLLGAIGMGSSLTLFLNEQLPTVGVLRCLGVEPRRIAALYHALCAAVGVQGALLGAAGGWLLACASLEALRGGLGMTIPIELRFGWIPLLEALAVAGVVAVGVPFARVRALAGVPPLAVLRDKTFALPKRPRATVVIAVLSLAALYGFSLWKSNSTQMARGFAGGLVAAAAMLAVLSSTAVRAAENLAKRFPGLPFALRHGLLFVGRERARSRIFLFTLSAGFGLLGALDLVRISLSSEIMLGKADSVPDLFLVDIQKPQLAGVRALTEDFASVEAEYSPLIRARLTHINDEPIRRRDTSRMTVEERSRQRFLLREYNLTYKDELNASETLIAGSFWSPGETTPQISLEKGFSERMRVGIGDRLRFDVQGRPLEAPVTSIRTIDWMSMKPNFFVVLPNAVLEPAPQNFIASFRLESREKFPEYQRALGRHFSNVSVIDLSKVLDSVQEVLGALLAALKGVAWFCVAVGLLVLAGTVALDREARARRTALLKALGCSPGRVIAIDAVSFSAIGLLTFAIGCLTALALGRLIAHLLEIGFFVDAGAVFRTLAAALVFPTAIGLLVNWRVYGAGVLETLRSE
jgi:putative ABC transport system permease protein